MAYIRLIPKTDDADFPYEKALARLIYAHDDMCLEPVNFVKLIDSGKRFGWSDEMVESHLGLEKRGKCLEFRKENRPTLTGTLWEDNIAFLIKDPQHEKECLPTIEALAKEFDVRIFRQ